MCRNTTAIGYARLSKEDRASNGDIKDQSRSIDNQIKIIRKYCDMRELELVDVIGDDDGVSRTTPYQSRPGGLRLHDAIESGKVGHVVVTSQERMFGRLGDAMNAIEDWNERNVSLHLASEDGCAIDTSTYTGWVTFAVKALFAESYPRQTADKMKSLLAYKKSMGQRVSRFATFGYRLVDGPPDKNGKPTKIQEPDEKEQAAITLMVEWRAQGLSLGMIARKLADLGYHGRDGKLISRSTIDKYTN